MYFQLKKSAFTVTLIDYFVTNTFPVETDRYSTNCGNYNLQTKCVDTQINKKKHYKSTNSLVFFKKEIFLLLNRLQDKHLVNK